MFGLPVATTWLLLGFPLAWIIYTIGFLYVSRNWDKEDPPSESTREKSP